MRLATIAISTIVLSYIATLLPVPWRSARQTSPAVPFDCERRLTDAKLQNTEDNPGVAVRHFQECSGYNRVDAAEAYGRQLADIGRVFGEFEGPRQGQVPLEFLLAVANTEKLRRRTEAELLSLEDLTDIADELAVLIEKIRALEAELDARKRDDLQRAVSYRRLALG